MTLRAVLDWANPDSTEDLNSRVSALFAKGVLTGGTIEPISGQLQISLLPFSVISYDGMLVTNDSATILTIPTDRTNVIAVHARHQIGDAAILEVVAIESGNLAAASDKDYYVIFGAVTTSSPATEVAETDIDYSLRETQDKRTRDKIRGMVNSVPELPSDPNFNVYGDMYVIYSGIGSSPNIYAWDGLAWGNITGTLAVAVALDKHQHNLDSDLYPADSAADRGRLHLTNYQYVAALGSYGQPGYEPSSPDYPFNRYVTQLDPRIPTEDQSDALQGSNGSPSATNKYVTEEYPIAAPTILYKSSPVYTLIDMSLYGPVYVGKGVVDTANVYFSLLDATENKGYLTSSGSPCKINAVYKTLFTKLDPSTDGLVDAYGFYQGANLWLGIDVAVDTASRLVYGKQTYLKAADHGFPILPTPNYEIISGTLLSTIANIKGRDFYEAVPTNEQNINLRKDIDDISQYVGSVLETNVVAGNEDFIRLSNEFSIFEKNVGVDYIFSFRNNSTSLPYLPSMLEYFPTAYMSYPAGTVHYYSSVDLGTVLAGDLFIDAEGNKYEVESVGALGTYTLQIKDIGSLPATHPSSIKGAYPELVSTYVDGSTIRLNVLTFKNTTPVSITWSYTNGWVQYGGSPDLSTVNVGDLFRDGGGVKYLVTAVDNTGKTLSIVNLETGVKPLTISTSVGSSLDGSTWINNNPRNLLLSEMKFNYGAEFVPVKKLVRKVDEYSSPEGQIAYGIVRFDNRFDPRVVFYGSWENYTTTNNEVYVRNSDGYGKFQLTGYFTDAFIVMRRRTNSGTITIKVNGVSSSTIDPTAGSTISSNVASLNGPKYQLVKLNSSTLSDVLPSTLTGTLPSVTSTDSFDVYGFVFLRNKLDPTLPTQALLESGRAFESAHIVRRDMPEGKITVDTMTYQGRGGRLVYAVGDNSYSRVISSLNDIDSNGTPEGTWTGSIITVTTTGGKLSSYSVNDIILVYSKASGLQAKLGRVTAVDTSLNTIQVNVTSSGAADPVYILHICSTDSGTSLSSQEDQIARYILPDDFINHTSTDLELIHQSSRFVLGTDGLTIISGQAILVTDANIIGSKKAVQIQQGSSGSLQFTVLATRLDLICVNNASANINVSVDGSPYFSMAIAGMAQRRTIFSNARYQTHEVRIYVTSVGGTFSVAEMILFGPNKPEFSSFPNIIADLLQIANYQASKTGFTNITPNIGTYPAGAVFKEATSHMSYLNGTGTGTNWAVSLDFTKALNYGYYIYSDKAGSYVEFYVQNSAFELQYITGPNHGYFNIFIDGMDIAGYIGLPGVTIVGNYSAPNGVDAYSSSYGRNNIGFVSTSPSILGSGLHKITAKIANPRVKNGLSTGYVMAFTGFFEGNNNGCMTMGINKYGVYSSIIDTRLFNPLDLTPLDPGTQVTEPIARGAKVNLLVGTTSLIVTLAEPYLDSDYIIVPCLMNSVDTSPLLQPILLTAQSASSFTVAWNVPIPNGNYSMHYFTRTLDV